MNEVNFDYWMFIAGLGMFLFGMNHLENGLKGLAGKSFKKLLQKFTNRSWKGIFAGTFVTAILQSSSLVTLLVLAFLGGGMISLQNSLGVVLGANLGTTVTAWVVATVGFKVNVSDLSFPFLAIGAFSYIMMNSRPILKNLGAFLVGFGLLFLGLDFMKIPIEKVASQMDLAMFSGLGLWIFLLVGLIITALIQSSSAMIVIVLSALNTEIITIHQSLAMVIGASIGTVSTLILGSIGGTADKKRLSLANVIFKVTAGLITFLLIDQMIWLVDSFFGIKDPLMELVLLNTFINIIGIIIFFPFLKQIGNFLNTRYKRSEPVGETMYIKKVNPIVSDVAIEAVGKELDHVYSLTNEFILDSLKASKTPTGKISVWATIFRAEVKLIHKYEHLKKLEDEITDYYTQIHVNILSEAESDVSAEQMMSLRAMIYSAKDIKDVIENIKIIDESDDDLARSILNQLQVFTISKLYEIGIYRNNPTDEEEIAEKIDELETFYNQTLDYLYRNIKQRDQSYVPISTLTNAIKKTISSLKNLTQAVYSKVKVKGFLQD